MNNNDFWCVNWHLKVLNIDVSRLSIIFIASDIKEKINNRFGTTKEEDKWNSSYLWNANPTFQCYVEWDLQFTATQQTTSGLSGRGQS